MKAGVEGLESKISELAAELGQAKIRGDHIEKEKASVQTKFESQEKLLSGWQEKALRLEQELKDAQKKLQKAGLNAEADQELMRLEFESSLLTEKKHAKNEERQ